MPKIDSLLVFLREQAKLKGRKLKIICDWDDCIQPFWPWILFKLSPEKDDDKKFPEWFEAYFNADTAKNKIAIEFIKKVKKEGLGEVYWKKFAEENNIKTRYRAPFTNVYEDLFLALKEDLIDDLLIISSCSYEGDDEPTAKITNDSCSEKLNKFFKTIGSNFSDIASFEFTELKKNEKGRYAPSRWERIKLIRPSFDILIDDRYDNANDILKHFSGKIAIVNDYQSNKKAHPDVYKLQTRISNIRDKDFYFPREQKLGKTIIGSTSCTESPQEKVDDSQADLTIPLNEIDSFYSLIKQKFQEKGRPLKIVADWDDCLQPLKSASIYTFIGNNNVVSFNDFFQRFQEIAVIEGSFSSDGKIKSILGNAEEEKAFAKYVEMRNEMREGPEAYQKSFYGSEERFKVPLSSIGKELLQAIKEGLVDDLLLISSYRKEKPNAIDKKRNKMQRTFGQFPFTKIELTEIDKDEKGHYKPYRWQRIMALMPDFDIFIDDNPNIIKEMRKAVLDENKFYAFPSYRINRNTRGPNIYHVKTTVSDLTDEDFVKAAEEWKANKPRMTVSPKLANFPLWICLGLGAVTLIGLIGYLLFKKNKK